MTTLSNLPVELRDAVCEFVEKKDLHNVRYVSRVFGVTAARYASPRGVSRIDQFLIYADSYSTEFTFLTINATSTLSSGLPAILSSENTPRNWYSI